MEPELHGVHESKGVDVPTVHRHLVALAPRAPRTGAALVVIVVIVVAPGVIVVSANVLLLVLLALARRTGAALKKGL